MSTGIGWGGAASARIAELEAEVENWKDIATKATAPDRIDWKHRAETAEAEVAEAEENHRQAMIGIAELNDELAEMTEAMGLIREYSLKRDLEMAEMKARRCETCFSWDRNNSETVAEVMFAYCMDSKAYKEFKIRVVSQGWLCPCWEAK